jgi:hypothetical protein
MHITPTRPQNRFVAFLSDPAIWKAVCLWAMIGGVGVYLAHALAAGA